MRFCVSRSNPMLNFLLKIPRWWSSALVICAVLYLTLFPKPLPDNDIQFWEHTDKLVHGLMMAATYWALAFDIGRGSRLSTRSRLWLLGGVIAFGGAIELAQGAMGLGRGASWGDFAADAAGTLIAALSVNPLLRAMFSEKRG